MVNPIQYERAAIAWPVLTETAANESKITTRSSPSVSACLTPGRYGSSWESSRTTAEREVAQERLPRRTPPPSRLPGDQQLAEIDAAARRVLVKPELGHDLAASESAAR
jgi:hypothetical protein